MHVPESQALGLQAAAARPVAPAQAPSPTPLEVRDQVTFGTAAVAPRSDDRSSLRGDAPAVAASNAASSSPATSNAVTSAAIPMLPPTDSSPKTLLAETAAPPKLSVPHFPGFDPNNLDPSVRPTDDFYHYADGGWIKNNPIPNELPRWGTFLQLAERNTKVCGDIMQEAASTPNAPRGSLTQKIGDFYASGMDTDAIEAAGLTPLQPELDRIAAIHTTGDLQSTVAHLHGIGVPVMFSVGSTQDAKDSTQVIGEVDQSGLGLPDRDYYFRTDEKSQNLREAYVEHIAAMFRLMGDDAETAQVGAAKVMAIETELAQHSRTRVQLRDPEANYNKMDRAGLAQLTSNLDWGKYLSDVGIADVKELNVGQPEFFQALDKQIGETPIEDWKTYLRWHVINATASSLSSKFVDENFHFKGTVLNGTPVNRPRWKRVVAASNDAIGELVGQAYVQKTFPPEAKQRVKTMVENLKGALREDLQTLSWMSPETRQKAIEKMEAFTDKIGYPDVWKNYDGLSIDRGPFILNQLRASRYAFDTDLAKIGKPVDRTEWHMTPQTVNAYYNPLMNEIVFPAGILQPPFFDPQADDAVNYGAIGAVIGHEMTHGFDDQGAQFDGQGNLRNWWTDSDLANFHQRTDAISALFDSFEVEPGLHVNGKLVTGEATADLGGLAIAYRAYKKSLEGQPAPPVLDGFTPQQRFFLGFSQVWAGAQRPEFDRMQVATDPHPPARFRVNGTLGNTPAFYEAYGVKPDDPMAIPPDKQTQIW